MSLPFDLNSLNPEQKRAVECNGGPLMVFAGAGSGKTRVVTCRIAKLIAEGVPASRIMAVTFTNKAAREMRERLEQMVGEEAKYLWMGTFHSTCAKLLRMDGAAIGIDRNFVVYDDTDQLSIVRDLIKRRNLDPKAIQPRAVLAEISRAKERLESPTKYAETAAGFFPKIVADIYKEYNDALRRANALDFDDILLYAVRLLEQAESVREKYQERFLHVMVDEYQDVNMAQYRLTHLLAAKHQNIMIVGDDDQSIYAWRGADVSLMLRFGSDYPDAQVITLAQNYRSTPNILKAAHSIIRHNHGRNEKQLWTDNPEGASVRIRGYGTENDEAMAVADSILREVRTGKRTYGQYGVLYRTNAQSRALEEAFLTMRIPHVLVGGQRFYDRKEIKDAMAYLRLAWNPADDASFRRIVNVPARGIGATTVDRIAQYASSLGQSMRDVIGDPTYRATLTKRAATALGDLHRLLEAATALATSGPVTPVLQILLDKSGYLDELRNERTDESISRLENLQELLNVTTQFDEGNVDADEAPTLGGFLEQVALVSDVDMLKESGEAVTLMTLHSSKGLEYPVVFLTGMEEGVFPHSRSLGDDRQLSEERRLCYVGMTRAREELHLTYARRRSTFGQANFNHRSRFLNDLPAMEVDDDAGYDHESMAPTRRVESERMGTYRVIEAPRPQAEAAAPWQAPFTVGQRVEHRKLGMGVVIACNPLKNDAEVTVAFSGATGIKKMVQSFAKLEAVS
ncbi:MAG TPA: UvrD-helicase domain-containing protein [Fimbriimonadaceae bacterium]|nr:UvrD-helicase domain-containing protein [Fimbriimonadaceae bacterium]HRE93095.1 UvrD-helicase domain-containing protein [Fimbriimonadaceae bacterium]